MAIDLTTMDETKPDGATEQVKVLDNYLREVRDNLKDWADVEHDLATGAHQISSGNTASRPTAVTGRLYINTQLARLEYYDGLAWSPVEQLNASLIDAKGDLLLGSAADTAVRLAIGSNGFQLTADSAATSGAKWLQIVTGTAGKLGKIAVSGSDKTVGDSVLSEDANEVTTTLPIKLPAVSGAPRANCIYADQRIAVAVSFTASTGTILSDIGVSSITHTGTGNTTVNFDTNFADGNYQVAGSTEHAGGSRASLGTGTKAVGSCQILTYHHPSNTIVDKDPTHAIFVGKN